MFDCQQGYLLGLDIGGANIKLFHTAGHAISIPFPMWLRPTLLADAIVTAVAGLPRCTAWGVTMTGELADVFVDRFEGVRSIVQQTVTAAQREKVDSVGFYGSPGVLLSPSQAIESVESVASANWHALAMWVSTWIDRRTLLIDVGSTTADIIPVSPRHVDTTSRTDHDRLRRGELVYVGIRRTPVCAIVEALPFQGHEIPVMREVFATTDDCALLLGWTPEACDEFDTCDSRPRTRLAAANRLARLIGLDHKSVTIDQATAMASRVMQRASAHISEAARRQSQGGASQWVISGHASQLITATPDVSVVDLASRLGSDVSRVAPAYAICELIRCGVLSYEFQQ
jgi:probable H4MPT-linked C1 transfer pathway protein